MTSRVYTSLGLRLINHSVSKQKSDGNFVATLWSGSITFETLVEIPDEVKMSRILETMLLTGLIPVHGLGPNLSGISYHWGSRMTGESEIEYCHVTLSYISGIHTITYDEKARILIELGYNPEEFLRNAD